MKLKYGVIAGCLLVLPVGAWAQDNVQGSGNTMAAPVTQPVTQPAAAPAAQPAPAAAPAVQPAPAPAAAAPAAAAPAKVTMPAPISRGSVGREAFTTGIKDREPTNTVTSLTNDVQKVYFFTVLRGLAGQTVTHRWEYNGKVMAEVHFKVGGSRWRVWSSKNLEPGWTGTWKVSVLNGAGQVISSDTLDYTAAPPKPAAQPKPAAPMAAPATPMNGGAQGNAMPEKQGTPVHDATPAQGE